MLLFLFSCVMPMLDTSDDMLVESDDQATYEVSKVDRSISSSVRLVIKYGAVESGHASGNYFKYGKHKFVITAAHVVDGGEVLSSGVGRPPKEPTPGTEGHGPFVMDGVRSLGSTTL